MEQILIVIPVYNEEKNIGRVIDDLKTNFGMADIIAVNDCSRDNTSGKLEELNIEYLNLPFNMGYSGAVQAGFKYAAEKDYDYVVQFDGDGQHMANEIHKLLEHIRTSGADIVIGSRFKINTDYPHPLFRRIGSKIFSLLIRWTCGRQISDPTSGFQILSRKAYIKYSGMFNYPQFPDANLIIKMMLEGFRIEEVPVRMKKREHGVSMHTGIIAPLKYMIKIMYSILIIILSFQLGKLNNRGDNDV